MCQININIQAIGTITDAEVRYKLSSSAIWSNSFPVDLNNQKTPDITSNGSYDLQVRGKNGNSAWSAWTSVSGFQIGNCSSTTQYEIAVGDCNSGNPNSLTWTTVYSSTTEANLDVGTTLYTDSSLTTPFQGNIFNSYRIRTSSLVVYDFSYAIPTTNGVINSKTDCSGGNNGGGGSGNSLVIDSTVPINNGTGTLTFTGGEPNEVLDLDFDLSFYTSNPTINKSIDFGTPVFVGTLNSGNTFRAGTVTLDSNGEATSNYTISEGELSCLVEITGRSSTEPIPTNDSINIDMPNVTVT